MLSYDNKLISDLTIEEFSEIEGLLNPYYVNGSMLLARAIANNTHIYLSRINEVIAAFFMIGWEKLIVDGEEKDTLYYGLSCVDINYRQSRIGGTVYMQAILDIAGRQPATPFIGWCTTATPIVIKVIRRYWRLIQPDESGFFDTAYFSTADAIRQKHYTHGAASQNPFILKEVATDTNYTDKEKSNLEEISANHNISIFEKLGIDEAKGDRLLVLMDLPESERLITFQESLKKISEEFKSNKIDNKLNVPTE